MHTFYALLSGLLGVIVVVLGWLVSHARMITEVLSALPSVEREVKELREHLMTDKEGGA